MKFKLQHTSFNVRQISLLVLSSICILFSNLSFSQVTSSIDSTKIKIGEQITYKIQVEADSSQLVVFPEGQTFSPLEMIESYPIDTSKIDSKFKLIKKYGLTQFDSGAYTIPRQKIIIGNKTFHTDSLKIEVNNIKVDTLKQGLYDIKPIIEVEKSASNFWRNLIFILLIIAVLSALIYWFVWRKKPLSEEDKIALLPPYDRAKLALKKLDESTYLKNLELKEYYSELTFIIRKYLDEKVYDRALESTTDELVQRLKLLKDANQVELSNDDIRNLETIFKRADLVKFAKSSPDVALAELDRNTIDLEIDHVKEALPEPTEEEKLLDQKYKEELARKKKRKKIVITSVIVLTLLIGTYIGFSIKYGFTYVKDTIIGNENKELLEGDWVKSEYGAPPIYITTPIVLERVENATLDTIGQAKTTYFSYGNLSSALHIMVSTTKVSTQGENKIDLNQTAEKLLKMFDNNGVKDVITKREQFITPNAAEGLKIFGTANFPKDTSGTYQIGNYTFLVFTAESVIQEIVLVWKGDDTYADQIMKRVINSIELKKVE
jgi:molybdopterin converting factor small subunit